MESVSRDTLGGETRDFSPEMVGGSWEGGFQEERSKCTAVRFMCLCDVRRLCVIKKKVAIMIIDIQSINTPHFNTFVFRTCVESCACISEADKNGVQAREFADLTLFA